MTTPLLQTYQGDDYDARIDVLNPDGTPANLGGYTCTAQIRRDVADRATTVDATFTVTMQTSSILLTLSHTITATLSGRYRYDVELVSATNQRQTIVSGDLVVRQDVTRAVA